MDLLSVKAESSSRKNRLQEVMEAESTETKCVKRRRRDSSSVVSSCEQKQQTTAAPTSEQAEQSSTPTTVKRSSRFRGVSRHRWTGRYEAHLWDKGSWNPTQRKKGKQVYLGAYDEEESAARAYDLAALKYWGPSTFTNFPVVDYEKELEVMKTLSKEEYLASLRRRSSGFSRGVSKYRGVARHHHNGRWEARIGRVFGNKYLYLGTYGTQEEAAHAYDIAAIEYRGINAVTNFDLNTYIRWLKPAGASAFAIQDPKTSTDPCPATSASSNLISSEQNKPPIFNPGPFAADEELINPSPFTKPSASPTALGLLLRSSVFKELVEKNLNTSEHEKEETDTENQQQVGKTSNDGSIFYHQVGSIPYINMLPGLESQEERVMPFYNRAGQFLWAD